MTVKEILIRDYDYPLPDSRIALHPLERRDECKLLLRSPQGKVYHRIFKELGDLIPPGSLMVYNDTKVINARLLFHKDTGAAIELFLLEPTEPSDYVLSFQARRKCTWKCLVGNSKKWKDGSIHAEIPGKESDALKVSATRLEVETKGSSTIEFSWENEDYTFGRIIEELGKLPIPPYLNRETEDSDLLDYQTIYARVKGSVAAPTAGLHFTDYVFESLSAHAVESGRVTLHVGAGTFRPVKSDAIGDHAMHSEPFTVTKDLIGKLIDSRKTGQRVVAVGTTTVRTLESLPYIGFALSKGRPNPFRVSQWDPYETENFDTTEALQKIYDHLENSGTGYLTADTSIMIAPDFQWRITEGIVTNFHQPKSTLLLLVSSFLGGVEWRKVYDEALRANYRFLSYGDACLFLR